MAIGPGSRLGPYEVTALIGEGGMGKVWRAHHAGLKRDDALKVLPDAFASDPDRLARFQREAQVLASLNHPNIAHVHGLEHQDDVQALVMELVEGPTLADRIAQGPIPVDEALPIAKQIAEALEAAHEQGIIHRDLKPANIKVRPDATVKVLDFGLAKALQPSSAAHVDVTASPTITSPAMMTGAGVILGTAAYMSPEQARGKAVDKRADIWAFGCVLYEMLTARHPFDGEDTTEVLGAVVRLEPQWDAIPSDVPVPIRTLLQNCLVKDPRRRVADISTAMFVLDNVAVLAAVPLAAAQTTPATAPRGRPAWMAAFGVAALGMLGLAIPAVRHLRETPPPPPPEMRVEIDTPATNNPISFALSPDGRQLAFVASSEGRGHLWLRPLGATLAERLPGTDGASFPFWSPDSKFIAFFADGKLRRIDASGGRPLPIADAVRGTGGTWNVDGVILFAPTATSPLFRVPASGGEAVAVTTLDRQMTHRFPFFLPDGRQFLFSAGGDTAGIYLGSMDSAETHLLTRSDTARTAYLPSGWLLWVRDGTLVAQRLDLERKALTGDPVTLADPVTVDGTYGVFARSSGNGAAALSVSPAGLVAYRPGGTTGQRQLTWFDRSGKALGVLGAADDSLPGRPSLSLDGRRVALHRAAQGNAADVWILDGSRMSRFTFDASSDLYPLWSPDSNRIVFDSNRKGHRDLYLKAANGAGSDELLLESAQDKAVSSWSPDGRFLLYRAVDPKTRSDLWVLPLDGDRKPFVFLSTPFDEFTAQFSPDGKWVAYQSTESGRWEIYVRPFPGPGGQWQISTSGGSQVRWRRDGKELYYVAPDGTLMAAAVAVNGATFEPDPPVTLFQPRIWGGGANTNNGQQYDVAPDGRFLINVTTEDEDAPNITLLQNWNPEATK